MPLNAFNCYNKKLTSKRLKIRYTLNTINHLMFIPIESNHAISEKPLILIDISGSTNDKFNKNHDVRQYEFKLARNLCKIRNYKTINVIVWENNARLYENVSVDQLHAIYLETQELSGGTHLTSAFNLIKPEHMSDDNKSTEIIILTDGEISDNPDKIKNELNRLNNFMITISIIAVEPNEKDYLNAKEVVGNHFYRIIKDNNLTRMISRFSVYNKLEKEFVNLSNPSVKTGYAPFRDSMFLISNMNKFVEYIVTEASKELSDVEYIKLAQDLSLSIYHLTKDKPYQYQTSIIELFSNIFKSKSIYSQIRSILLNEVNNHIAGKASTFTELRKQRHLDIENTNLNLMDNVYKAVTDMNITQMDNLYKYSFLLKSSNKNVKNIIIRTTDAEDVLENLNVGWANYARSSIKIGNYKLPLLMNPNKMSSTAAIQWLKMHYSRCLNISPSNEFIYYYVLADALIANISIYDEYCKLVLNELKFGSDKSVIQDIINSQKIQLPINVLNECCNYSKLNINAMTLYYLIADKYLFNSFSEPVKSTVIDSMQKFCMNDVIDDYKKISGNEIQTEFNQMIQTVKQTIENSVEIIDVNKQEIQIIEAHPYNDSNNIECPARLNSSDKTGEQINCDNCDICDICGAIINVAIINKTNNVTIDESILTSNRYCFDIRKHINLGYIDDNTDDLTIFSPDTFVADVESYEIGNHIIVDPVSSTSMKIRNNQEFVESVNTRYPFLKDLDMSNVALCGGFARSILLKQQMKDFDFFFYGLNDDASFVNRVKTLINDITTTIKKLHPDMKFGLFYKPLYNVFEMICFEDPTNHINAEFTLENFHKYKYKSLRRFKRRGVDLNNKPKPKYNPDDDNDDEQEQEEDEQEQEQEQEDEQEQENKPNVDTVNPNNKPLELDNEGYDKFYFEDGDQKGIKMRYRIQFVMCKYQSISNIFNSFDMFPSRVAYDGKQVYFTKKSLMSYRYMINELNLMGGTVMVKHRINKYFKYGFSIVFPHYNKKELVRDWSNNFGNLTNYVRESNNENVGPLTFKVRKMIDNVIYINHNSNIEKMLEKNDELEKKCLDKGDALYMSSLFCSFVSVLRYVSINNIDYVFPNNLENITDVFDDCKCKFKTGEINLKFLEKYNTKYEESDWYKDFYKSMFFTKYS